MDNLSDLIKKAQKGDKDAFGQIYNLFNGRIYRYLRFNLPAGRQSFTEDPQDLCQETFLRAYTSISKFTEKKGGSFQAYLFRIARNLAIDHKRKKKDVPLKDYWEIETDEILEDAIDKKQEALKVHLVLSKLKEKERQIIILRYFEEMTTAEVAKVMGMRQGALRVRAHRLLQKLKDMIEKNEQ